MPAPMPREAPVTSATLPKRVGNRCAARWGAAAASPLVVWPFDFSEGAAAPLVVVVALGSGLDGASVLGGAEMGSDVGSGAPFDDEWGGASDVVVVVVGVGSAVTGRAWEICSREMESIFFFFLIERRVYLL